MARRGAAFVKGIDMAEQSLETARLHAALNNVADIEYECIRVEDLAEAEPHSFDVVTCMEMMEHVPIPPPSCVLVHPGQTGRHGVFLPSIKTRNRTCI